MSRRPLGEGVLAWLSAIRVGNSIALGYAAIVGYLLGASNGLDGTLMLRVFMVAFSIGGSSNLINDYYDLPIDSINKPWRPIPSGLIKARTAYFVAMILAVAGIAISVSISFTNGLIALLAFALSYAYSRQLKKTFIVGNVIIAFLSCLTIIYGGVASKNIESNVIIAALFAFLLNLGREFIKGMEDIEGDKKYGIKTLATVLGLKIAYIVSAITFAILISLSLLPYLLLGYSICYLILAIIGVDLTIVVAMAKASTLRPKDALTASRILKIAAFCGITAFFIEAVNLY